MVGYVQTGKLIKQGRVPGGVESFAKVQGHLVTCFLTGEAGISSSLNQRLVLSLGVFYLYLTFVR